MRSELAKAVKKDFSRRFLQQFHGFVPQEPTGALRGGLLYKWQHSPDLSCFVYLQISQKMYQDCFMVEIACSKGEFPIHLVAFDPNEVRDGSVRFRLPELYRDEWRQRSRRVPWWWIGPEITPKEITARAMARVDSGALPEKNEGMLPIDRALPLVEPQVQDAVDRIKRFGIPFFQRFGGWATSAWKV
jgi:hypothetical protein